MNLAVTSTRKGYRMSTPRDTDWAAILKAAGVDVSFVEYEIRALQRTQRIRAEEEPLREFLYIPDDIRAVTGDEIELWNVYRGYTSLCRRSSYVKGEKIELAAELAIQRTSTASSSRLLAGTERTSEAATAAIMRRTRYTNTVQLK